jgi:hypothetical protein
MHPPDRRQLLELEQGARRHGSGITAAELLGCWQLQAVWPRTTGEANGLSGWLLRQLQARLEIAVDADGLLGLSNAVNLGALELRFRGPGQLIGARPLLRFHFTNLCLSLGQQVLIERHLPTPTAQKEPFFALIHRDRNGWLMARGRGGGLALWTLRD